MFDDLIKETNKKKSKSIDKISKSEGDRAIKQHMLNLLLDAEDALSVLYNEVFAMGGDCMYCGKTEGVAHKTNCTYRTLRLRLQMEIDRYV